MDANDELFSTSTVREVFRGFFEEKSTGPLTADELESLENLMKQISDARIPTRYSGFATREGRMQHPTGGEPYFGRPSEAHGRADLERRQYVLRAMDDAAEDEAADAVTIAQAGLRAAIEYTLNNFTAPVTARNVFRHSRRSSYARFDADHLEQVRARELMKDRADVTDYSSDTEDPSSDTDDPEISASAAEESPGDERIDPTVSEMPDAEEESVENSGPLTDLMRTAVEDPDLVSMEVGGTGVMEVAEDAVATEAAGGVVGAIEGAIETIGEGAAVVAAAL